MSPSKQVFTSKLPKLDFQNCLLIYDRKLLQIHGAWVRRFPHSYGVQSGERLKDARFFSAHASELLKLSASLAPKKMTVVAFGGGSVGDFSGFFASVFKRGVRFVNVPSTWLAALDSAHGGKTALNLGSLKNQLGSFYPAEKVFLVREVLLKLDDVRFQESWPEAVKVALLDGEFLSRRVRRVQNSKQAWTVLPALIQAKLKIVRKDPFEEKGIRHLLNFGHTLGHVIEAQKKISHGESVGLGLQFALEWSRHKKILLKDEWQETLPSKRELARILRSLKNAEWALMQDKKRVSSKKLRFIFLKKPGRPVIREVSVDEVLREIQRQSR